MVLLCLAIFQHHVTKESRNVMGRSHHPVKFGGHRHCTVVIEI